MFVEHVVNTSTTTNSNTTSNHHSSVCKHLLSITLPIFSLCVSRYLSLRARGCHRINILVALGEFLRRIIAYTSRWASIAYPLHPLTIEPDTHTHAHTQSHTHSLVSAAKDKYTKWKTWRHEHNAHTRRTSGWRVQCSHSKSGGWIVSITIPHGRTHPWSGIIVVSILFFCCHFSVWTGVSPKYVCFCWFFHGNLCRLLFLVSTWHSEIRTKSKQNQYVQIYLYLLCLAQWKFAFLSIGLMIWIWNEPPYECVYVFDTDKMRICLLNVAAHGMNNRQHMFSSWTNGVEIHWKIKCCKSTKRLRLILQKSGINLPTQ